MLHFWKVTLALIVAGLVLLGPADGLAQNDTETVALEVSARQLLNRLKENEDRTLVDRRAALDEQLRSTNSNAEFAELLVQALIFDVEHTRLPDMYRHADLLDNLAIETNDQELTLISALFSTYARAIESGGNQAAKARINSLIRSAKDNDFEQAAVFGQLLLAIAQAMEGQFFQTLTVLNASLQQLENSSEGQIIDLFFSWTIAYLHTELSSLALAIEEYDRAIDIALSADLPIDTLITLYNIGTTLIDLGYFDIAEEYISYYGEYAGNFSSEADRVEINYFMARVTGLQGKFESSHEYVQQTMGFYPDGSWRNASLHQIDALNLVNMGRVEEAQQNLEVIDAYFEAHPDEKLPQWTWLSERTRALISLESGDPRAAIDTLIALEDDLAAQLRRQASEHYAQTMMSIQQAVMARELEAARTRASLERRTMLLQAAIVAGLLLIAGVIWQRRSAAHLHKSKKEAELANRTKTEFLTNMSHELRTPLNAIIGFSEMLERGTYGDLNKKNHDFARYIGDGGKLLLKLITDLLHLSRMEAGGVDIKIREASLDFVISPVGHLVKNLLDENDIKLHVDMNAHAQSIVRVDPIRIGQILINLISNSAKYGRKGGNVWLSVDRGPDGFMRVTVKDDGVGIAERQFENVFKPFNRAGKENSGIEGTGAGLTIAKGLMEAMNGNIGFESVEGKGSTFWIDLPLSG